MLFPCSHGHSPRPVVAGSRSLAAAQVPERGRADSLAAVLSQLTARIDSLEVGLCPASTRLALPAPSGNARADSLLAVTAELDRRLGALRASGARAPRPRPGRRSPGRHHRRPGGDSRRRRRGGRRRGSSPRRRRPIPCRPAACAGAAAPRNASALNPEISATGDIRLVAREGRQHDNGVAREFEFGFSPPSIPTPPPRSSSASRTTRSESRKATSTGPDFPAAFGWTWASSASRSATSIAGTSTHCPRPNTRWSTSASSLPKG